MSLNQPLVSFPIEQQEIDFVTARYNRFYDDFVLKAGATLQLPWTVRSVGTPTAPAYVTQSGTAGYDGILRLALAATNEAENTGVDWADNCLINEDGAGNFDFLVKFTRGGALASTDNVTIGLASAYNADPDLIASSAFFKLNATTTQWYVETDDGTTEVNATATGVTCTDGVYYGLRINMSDLRNVKFFISVRGAEIAAVGNAPSTNSTTNTWKQVCETTRFSMPLATGLQPLLLVIKASSTRTHSLDIDATDLRWRKRGS